MSGRPLRFLAATLGGWAALRVFALWPSLATVEQGLGERGIGRLVATPAIAARLPLATAINQPLGWRKEGDAQPSVSIEPPVRHRDHVPPARRDTPAAPPERRIDRSVAVATSTIPPPAILPPVPVHARSRWAASAWAIVRGGSTALLGGQLGGSQAGVRVTYALDPAHRVALAGRVAAPLAGRGREAAIGIDWQPTRAPVHLIAEQRIGLDGNRGGPTLALVGGLGPRPIAKGIDVEGYAQAGVIARDGGVGFADGALRVTHALVRRDRKRIELGLGAWGGVQPGVARIDIGPSLGVVLPVADKAVRLTLDWRARVAGAAAPGSGPALSIGSDF